MTFEIHIVIVYYAGSKSKECARSHVICMTDMRSEAFFICSCGAYTISLSGEAENTTFLRPAAGSKSGTFGPIDKKNSIFSSK